MSELRRKVLGRRSVRARIALACAGLFLVTGGAFVIATYTLVDRSLPATAVANPDKPLLRSCSIAQHNSALTGAQAAKCKQAFAVDRKFRRSRATSKRPSSVAPVVPGRSRRRHHCRRAAGMGDRKADPGAAPQGDRGGTARLARTSRRADRHRRAARRAKRARRHFRRHAGPPRPRLRQPTTVRCQRLARTTDPAHFHAHPYRRGNRQADEDHRTARDGPRAASEKRSANRRRLSTAS